MAFRLPSLDGLTDVAIAVARAILPTRNWSRRFPGWKFLRAIAVIGTDLHAQISDGMLDLLPDTARGIGPGRTVDMLARWGGIKKTPRKGATAARGSNAGRVTGTPTTAVTAGLTLTHAATGQSFEIGESDEVGASGYVDVDIVAVSKGAATRLTKGEVLVLDVVPTGLAESVTLVADLDQGGEDQEQDGPYRTRVLDRFANQPLGGAQNDYATAALEVDGIASAYCYPNRKGLGSVDLAVLHDGSGSERIPTSDERAVVLAKILTGTTGVWRGKPVGADLSRILEVIAAPVDIELEILPNGEEAFEFDWVDQTPMVVATWNAGTRTLTFTDDRPDSMEAGGTIVIADVAVLGTGEPYEIESLGAGSDDIVLRVAPVPAPVATDVVYAGGPLTEPVRDALLDHVDHLGTANPDAASYGPWEAAVRPEACEDVGRSVAGVKTAVADAPVATFEPADPEYPDDGTIELATPGRVLVRRRW